MNTLTLLKPTDWTEYELLDSGHGERLERYAGVIIRRPDPQVIWSPNLAPEEWRQADATFTKTYGDKGVWRASRNLPESWPLKWQDLTAMVKLTPFKHTGIFPEQSAHWAWMRDHLNQLKKDQPTYQPHILNLFAYTGMASVVCAKAGAKVTHVDASHPAIGWAKVNQAASGLDEKSIRWILDDVLKFVGRENKRGVKYDGIIMDPPVYGHGPTGEVWDFPVSFPELLEACKHILVDHPLFVIVNAYAVSSSSLALQNVLQELMADRPGEVSAGELVLEETSSHRLLSTGIFARWQAVNS